MATTLYSDLKVYDEQFQGGFIETIMQEVDAFNAASRGALTLDTRPIMGHYEKEAFWDERVGSQSGIARRDIGSTSSVTAISMTQDEFIGVKLNRRNGPYETTVDAYRKAVNAGMSPEAAAQMFSRILGVQTAKELPREMLDRALAALEGKLDSVTALEHDATDGILQATDLGYGLKKFGDNARNIVLWVMRSEPFHDLLIDQLGSTASVYASDTFGASIYAGNPATLNRPVLVVDSASLVESNGVSTGVDAYSTLGLTRRAAELVFSEAPIAALEGPLTGYQNITYRWQGEYAYNLKLKGCQWDTANGGVNPTDAAVATSTNWDTVVASTKSLPGVIIKSR